MEKSILQELACNQSSYKIAKTLRVSQTKVAYWLRKHGLKSFGHKSFHIRIFKCIECGEENRSKFYRKVNLRCRHCHNQHCIKKQLERRDFALESLGGKCFHCGFKKWKCALDIHHKDPSQKNKNWQSCRNWSHERILKEIKDCVLLCKICHSAYHDGLIDLGG